MTVFVSARFRRALDRLLVKEGGFSDHPNDRGGATKYGISQRSYPTVNIRALTRDDAAQLYHKDYWSPLNLDRFASEPVAMAVFEFGVHAGIGPSARALQRAVNAIGKPITVDGCIGPATLALVAAIPGDRLLASLHREILAHYQAIVDRNPSQQVFLQGWKNRLNT